MQIQKVSPKQDQPYNEWKDEFTTHVKKSPGLYRIKEKFYHDSYGLNQSKLKTLLKTPLHFKHSIDNPTVPSEAMIYGSAVHKLFFEPEEFAEDYIDVGSIDKRTKVGKAKMKEIEENNPNATLLKSDVMDSVRACVKAIHKHPVAMSMLGKRPELEYELSGYGYVDQRIMSRGRADAIDLDRGIIADLKTTSKIMPDEFQKHSFQMGYHIQAAYYLDLFSNITGEVFDKFVMVSVESSEPHAIQVYVCDPDMIVQGRREYKNAINKYLECSDSGIWPGFDEVILNLSLPRWATK